MQADTVVARGSAVVLLDIPNFAGWHEKLAGENDRGMYRVDGFSLDRLVRYAEARARSIGADALRTPSDQLRARVYDALPDGVKERRHLSLTDTVLDVLVALGDVVARENVGTEPYFSLSTLRHLIAETVAPSERDYLLRVLVANSAPDPRDTSRCVWLSCVLTGEHQRRLDDAPVHRDRHGRPFYGMPKTRCGNCWHYHVLTEGEGNLVTTCPCGCERYVNESGAPIPFEQRRDVAPVEVFAHGFGDTAPEGSYAFAIGGEKRDGLSIEFGIAPTGRKKLARALRLADGDVPWPVDKLIERGRHYGTKLTEALRDGATYVGD